MNQRCNSPAAAHLAAFVAGALLPLALAPFHLWPLSIVSCGLLVTLLRDLSPRQVFKRCFSYGMGMFGVGVSWVFVSVHTHGGESIPIALLLTFLLVLLLTLCFAVPFTLYGFFSPSSVKRLLVFPAVWVLAEWLRGWMFTGFPWLYLGNAFIDTWLAGWAPVGGVLAMSLIGVLTAAAIAELFGHRIQQQWSLAAAPVIAVALLWVAATGLQTLSWTRPVERPLSLTMIQPAVTPSQKWNSRTLYDNLVLLRDLSAGHWHNDLMIWPESAIPETAERVAPFVDYMAEVARETDTVLITGIPILEDGRYYNGVTLLGNGEGSYRKRHLVPFGEYLPLDSLLRGIIDFFNRPMSNFSAGAEDQALLRARDTAIATAICYEIIFQDLVSAMAKDAEIILTLSNDVWFGDSIGPHQHLQMARLRAIENRKPVVRDTNDGITAVIDADGEITHHLPQFEPGTLEAEVLPRRGTTPFNRFGSWPVVLGCMVMVGFALSWRRRK